MTCECVHCSKRRSTFTMLLVLAVVLMAHVARGTPSVVADEPPAWAAKIQTLLERHPGEAAVAIRHLPSGASFRHRADVPMPTASLIKLPIMIEAYRQAQAGQCSLDDRVVLRDEDKVPGSGILTQHFSAGASFSLRDAIRMMIAWSDNTATNLVIDRIGLPATTETMSKLDCPQTRLHSKVFRRDTSIAPERSREFGLGSTTADEMIRLLERLHQRDLVSRAASDEMLAHLVACQDNSTFRRGLPTGARLAHKTGSVTGVRTDAGVIQGSGDTIVLCVLTRNNRREKGSTEDPGERLCAEIARTVYEHYHPPGAPPAAPGLRSTQLGDSGEDVVRIQKALNATRDANDAIEVDGEFGPQTHAAVLRFQGDRGLRATGIVDAATWQALDKR